MAERYRITNPQTGQTVTVSGDAPPSPADIDAIFAQMPAPQQTPQMPMREVPAIQPPAPLPGVGALAMEGIAGFNRPFAWLADNVALAPINTVLQLQGKEPLSIQSALGEKGQFAGEGLLVDAASAAGELTSMAIGGGGLFRQVTSMIDDAARISTSTVTRVLAQLGKSKPSQDVVAGLSAGAGGEFSAAAAGRIFGEDFEQSGRMVGQFVSPIALTTTANTIINAGRGVLNISPRAAIIENAPAPRVLKGASNALYSTLDEAGIIADSKNLIDAVTGFKLKEEITSGLFPEINRLSNEMLTRANQGDMTFGYLNRVRSVLGGYSGGNNAEAAMAAKLSEELTDVIENAIPLNPEVLGNNTVKQILNNASAFWRRGKAADIVDEIFEKSRIRSLDGSEDFGVAIRQELKDFLKPSNKKAHRSFTKADMKMIEEAVRGTSAQRAFETINVFGGANSNDWYKATMFSAAVGAAGFGAAGASGSGMALAATFTSAKLAQMAANRAMTRNANLLRAVIRAGPDSMAVTRAYLSGTPAELRNAGELSALLLNNRADLSALRDTALGKSPIVSNALFLASIGQRAIDEEAQEEQQ
jgi:hypothetical protein